MQGSGILPPSLKKIPGSAAGTTTRQRGVYSELLSQGLPASSVVGAGNYDIKDSQNQAVVKASSFVRPSDLDLAADASEKAMFEDKSIEPKVIAPYETRPGQIPRKIEIERKKRLYANQDIEMLLAAKGIDYTTETTPSLSHLQSGVPSLPLEAFDNEDFEVREPQDWIKCGSGRGYLPARALKMTGYGTGVWADAKVTSYNKGTKKFNVEWVDGSKVPPSLSRMHICFVAEDPFNFVERVVDAHARRNQAEKDLLYKLYIDCMPTDDMKPLDAEQCARIQHLAVNSKILRKTNLDTSVLMNEISIDYLRTMNRIVLDDTARKAETQDEVAAPPVGAGAGYGAVMTSTLEAPFEPLPPPPPATGTLPTALVPGIFQEHSNEFLFNSFLTNPDIIRIIVAVKVECAKMMETNFFSLATKTIQLEEFRMQQQGSIDVADKFLNITWPATIIAHIRSSLRNVKKGWFNLEESNNEVYGFSKLKKFLMYINFNMQDSMRYMIEDCLSTYSKFITDICDAAVEVKSPSNVTVTTKNNPRSKRRPPLFSVDLVIAGENFGNMSFDTSTSGEGFETAPLETFDSALKVTQSITQIEKKLMVKLFWSNDPVMTSVHPTEEKVKKLREEISDALKAAVVPLREYVKLYDKYISFLNDEPAEILLSVEEKYAKSEETWDVNGIKKLIISRLKQKEDILADIPEKMNLGLFTISTKTVRTKLADKCDEIVDLLKELIINKTFEFAELANAFTLDALSQLSHKCENIEEVTERRELFAALPLRVKEQQPRVDNTLQNFKVLDELQCKLPESTDIFRWKVYGMAKSIYDRIEVNELELVTQANQQQSDMEQEQEAFTETLKGYKRECESLTKFTDISKVGMVSALVRRIKEDLKDADTLARQFNSREQLFGKEITEYTQIKEIGKLLEPFYDLWCSVDNWTKWEESWLTDSFLKLDAELIEKNAQTLNRTMIKTTKYFDRQGIKGCDEIAVTVKAKVDDFMPKLPLIVAMRNPGMRDRHWQKISDQLNLQIKPTEETTLQSFLDMGLQGHVAKIEKICETAGREFGIEQALDKMEGAWKDVPLQIESYKETGSYVLKGIDEYYALLDEHITMVQAMSFSAFKGPFEERIDVFDQSLSVVSEVIEEWVKVQKNWLYLQPIFDSADINKQLPVEGKRFSTVDKHWRSTMNAGYAGGQSILAIKFCDDEKLLGKFRESNKLLDMVQKGLSEYIQTKQAAFSRFYFLSDGDLLEILSETKDPKMVQPHLSKCFEGIKCVNFTDELKIVAMNDSNGKKAEHVEFTDPVDPVAKNIEVWMNELLDMMLKSVRHQMILGIEDYMVTSRCDWMQKWPSQIVINASQLYWTKETEEALAENGNAGLIEYQKQCEQQLSDIVTLVRSGKLNKKQATTVGATAVMDVHAKDMISKMAAEGCASSGEFSWMSQLRFYWHQDEDIPESGRSKDGKGNLRVIMMTSNRGYGYEYLGNSFRLVVTPLTDKCYLTLMGALQMILGGAPAGPAGTGKTETTKDLAKALAKQCVVFNCSDGLDYKAMGKFFKGLAGCGAWACFDEFNRIQIEVLSVIAQQVLTLQGAVQRGEKRINFEDTDIFVDPEFAVFITMNPGYAGRSALPDNLEALFRPVAMMVPDYSLIGMIMLLAYGYEDSLLCAKKMVATFKLCSEQLSSQDHYDYGMRAVKTVITAAGKLKAESPHENEQAIMLRALQDVNIPKFLAFDLPLFDGILSDLFPGIKRPPFDYGPLNTALKLAAEKNNLQPTPYFLVKNIELYEMICVRHGLMVVGPTGGGKSCNIRCLKEALTDLRVKGIDGVRYEKVSVYHLNPKSIKMGQLYGMFDENTREWQDGILANLMRVASRITEPDLQWTLFDGPVDAIWIENMNTVLDDNKKLCLTSGEIMALSEAQTMMFEPEDLAVASPATVSRCGMIYMEPTSLGYNVLLQSWLNTLPEGFDRRHKMMLQGLFETYLPGSLNILRRTMSEPFPTVNNALVESLLKILDCYFADFIPAEDEDPILPAVFTEYLDKLESQFIFALIWSIMTTVSLEGRKMWSNWLKVEMQQNGCKLPLPDSGMVYDYFYDNKSNLWTPWMDTIDPYTHDANKDFSQLIIPTPDSVRYTYLLDLLVTHNKHVIMTGPTGTGKTVNINKHLQTGFSDKYIAMPITFSAQTSANDTQDLIDSKTDKRRKGVYGPAMGKKFVIFVDDLNMPQKEEYGAQPPIEILRQWFDSSGWYDRKELVFRKLIDCIMVCACGPPGGGRNQISARFPRHFNVIGYTDLEDESMMLIFSTIMNNFLIPFAEELHSVAKETVHGTIDIYRKILDELRPTPAKSHYQFNLRDVSKVFQGLLMMSNKKVDTKVLFCRHWIHEVRRVFGDRLINSQDRSWLDQQMHEKLKHDLHMEWDDVVDGPILVCDFMIPGADPRIYELIENVKDLQPTVEEYLGEYNAESKQPMHLVMFMDALEHIVKISRVIRQPGGNMLLLGVGGSGRQSLSRLSTFMAEFKIFEITIAKGYGPAEWRENLRECLLQAGVEDTQTVFLFNDTQVVFESMLEDVNNILNTGDVPNLYTPEDMDQIQSACKPDCMKKRLQPTKLNIFACYVERVKRNIHMCLCMSPLGDAFRERLRKFPSIVNCCTTDWFSEWPDEALQSVAMRAMTENDLKLGDHLESTVSMFRYIHQSVAEKAKDFKENLGRYTYVTPTSYLEVLSTYKKLLGDKRKEVGTLKDKLSNGLEKLLSTAEMVGKLQVELTAMEPILIQTTAEVEEMIIQIDKDKAAAEEVAVSVGAEEAAAKEKAAETKAIADDAQRDLDEALPALDEAVACLKKLNPADINEVKQFKVASPGVKLTMQACCILFQVKVDKIKDPDTNKKVDDFFGTAKKDLLSKGARLIDDMKNYEKDNIPDSVINKLKPLMDDPAFTPDMVKKASVACMAMCMWGRAMYKYYTVTLIVEPKKKLLAEKQIELDATMEQLAKAQAALKEVTDKVQELESNLEGANAKKDQLNKDVTACRARLDRAQKLIGGLGGERVRWGESVESLTTAYVNIDGDTLVSAGVVSYASPFTPTYRKQIVKDWQNQLKELKIPHSDGADLTTTLLDPVANNTWKICGLPQDSHSIENGIIMSKARRYPLLIDPQGQANKYIRNMGKDPHLSEQGIEICKLTDKNFLRTLENGVRFGRWVLMENIGEQLDASLEPLLLQQRFVQQGTEYIKIGDSQIPWHNQFRFFMTTKMPNPHYAPEVCVKVSLVNFAITPSGLEDQILGIVVIEERPDMEEKKNALVLSNARMQKELSALEDLILTKLREASGNILDDHELIETLAVSKKKAQEITAQVEAASVTEKEIDISREKYRPVAYRATLLYFAVSDLAEIDPMYQYSLQWYCNLFVSAIRASEPSDDLEKRLGILNEYFTYYLYCNVCRSLFENDKLLFSFVLTIKILQGNKEIDPDEWLMLISGKVLGKKDIECPAPEENGGWMNKRCWTDIENMCALPIFRGIEESFEKENKAWQAYFDNSEPHLMDLPGKWNIALNSFQKLIVLRALRPDRVSEALMNFVVEKMQQRYVEPPPFNLEACFADSNNLSPLIFILSKGSDPTKAFLEFGKLRKFDKKIAGCSLGQGQAPLAEAMITNGMQKGTWVYLQNCHLYLSWLTSLERICEDMEPETTHKDFRLWLTSMPAAKFPVSILQNGVKMTNEPPKGLKANLRNAYFKLDNEKLQKTTKPEKYMKLLFGLSFFHAISQERRKYGPLGWNIPYEFNDTDLDISVGQLEMWIDSDETDTMYDVVQFLTSYINYGGRVTDAIDLRTITAIIKKFCNKEVLNDGYKFDKDGLYISCKIDTENPYQGYMDYIDTLPLGAGPQIFGLHDNANISCANQETFATFATILSLQSKAGGGGGGGRDEMIAASGSKYYEDLSKYGQFDIEATRLLYPVTYSESMNTVLVQECIRYNKLIAEMERSLPLLLQALKGLVVMSSDLEAMANAVAVNVVPSNWTKNAYPSMKPLAAWEIDLMERLDFITTWIEENAPPVFWISGFYFPQAFLTGVLQNFARKNQYPIDHCEFDFIMCPKPCEEYTVKPEDGAYIRGLFMEGARWDATINSINDSLPKQLYTPIPVIHLSPVKDRVMPTGGIYQMPVYKILSRRGVLSTTGHSTNFVCWIEIPSNRETVVQPNFVNQTGRADQEDWINAGVAAFTSLMY